MTVRRRTQVMGSALTIGALVMAVWSTPVDSQGTAPAPAGAPVPGQAPGGVGPGGPGGPGAPGGQGGRGRGGVIQEYPADPNDVVQAINGFRVEVVAKADRPTQGSWISLAEDDQGRLILGANEQQPFTRLTLDKGARS